MNTIESLRQVRIFDMAVFDWVASLFGAYILGKHMLKIKGYSTWILWISLWILFGVVVHASLGIPTKFGYFLGVNEDPRKFPAQKM